MASERASAQTRLSDAAERYEASAQQARIRLVAEHDRRMATAEDDWRRERRELQERVKAAEAMAAEAQAARDEGIAAVRDSERRTHAAALKVGLPVNCKCAATATAPATQANALLNLQNLKAEYEADNQGWRQAVAQKAKTELVKTEESLREQLEAERDSQIELVRAWTCHQGA